MRHLRRIDVLLSPLYVLIAIQVWPIGVMFASVVIVHVLDRLFGAWEG
jgi:hypothetical protein